MASTIPVLHPIPVPQFITNKINSHFLDFSVLDDFHSHIGLTHWHDYFQLWYTVSGSYTQIINGKAIEQSSGSLAIISPFTIHAIDTSCCAEKSTRIIRIDLYDRSLQNEVLSLQPISYEHFAYDGFLLTPYTKLSGADKKLATAIFEKILFSYKCLGTASRQTVTKNIANIFNILIKNATIRLSPGKLRTVRNNFESILAVANYIDSRAIDKISFHEISSVACMSKTVFAEKFKAITGQTFHAYHLKVRMKTVINLLRFSNFSLNEIAERTGFYNYTHLNNVIRQLTDMSPSHFRHSMWMRTQNFGQYLLKFNLTELSRLGLLSDDQERECQRNYDFVIDILRTKNP